MEGDVECVWRTGISKLPPYQYSAVFGLKSYLRTNIFAEDSFDHMDSL